MTLRHVAIQVSDIERSVDFYANLADYEVVRSFTAEDGTRNVFVGRPDPSLDDDAAMQLVDADGDGSIETGDFVHTALTVDDVDATVAALEDDRITGAPETLEEEGLRVAFVDDPDGWGVELIEHV
jgi:lactoylglutathione lyase